MAWAGGSILRLAGIASLLVSCVASLSPIEIKGSKLYDEDGKQFFVKGIAYSPYGASEFERDPLIDTNRCQVDAGLISDLGANTIRVYSVGNDSFSTSDREGCMKAFANAGLYIWLDLTTPWRSFNRNDPEWTQNLYDAWTKTIDDFAEYDNLLFFTISNEVVLEGISEPAEYIKAATRDIKAFIRARGYRRIPIIYASSDEQEVRAPLAEYLTCGDEDETLDAYGINVYSWCGESSFYDAGYDTIYEEFQDLSVPVIFSETGCTPDKGNRTFPDVQAMLGSVLQAVFSGVVVYEYSMHVNEYGIVEYPSSGSSLGFASTLAEYNSLAKVYSTMNPSGTSKDDYTPSNSASECTESRLAYGNGPLPTISGLDEKTITQRGTYSNEPSSTGGSRTTTGRESSGSEPTGSSERKEQEGGNQGSDTIDDDDGDDDSDSGLSGGAIGGIAAGVGVVALGVAATAAFFFLRRRKARTAVTTASPDDSSSGPEKDSAAVYEVASPTAELQGGQQYLSQELDGSNQHTGTVPKGYYGPGSQWNPAELGNPVYELPSGK